MKVPINIDTKNISNFLFSFAISFILLLCFEIGKLLKEVILNGWNIYYIIILIIFSLALLISITAFLKMIPILRRRELLTDKILEEQAVNEVIDQDFKLLQMKILEREHKMKVDEWNKKNPNNKFDGFIWRNIESIAKQALDTEFYEKTYGYRLIKQKNGKTKK